MNMPFDIGLGPIEFLLQKLRGLLNFDSFIKFDESIIKKISQLTRFDDPRSCLSDMNYLSKIHEDIKNGTESLSSFEKTSARYWLASLFHHYFLRYELNKEGWGCRKAWANLLKMRYLAMASILHQRNNNDEATMYHFRLALRDWRDFCTDKSNHFMFNKGNDLETVEEEVKQIIYIKDKCNTMKPLSFFTKSPEGKQVLDRLISDWFLRDRYDFWGAIKLTGSRIKNWFFENKFKGYIYLFIAIIFILIPSISLYIYFGSSYSIVLSILYCTLLILGFICILSRVISNIFLPRLLVSILVGYLPLIMTSEIWKMVKSLWYWQIFALGIFSSLLSFVYLRWEIGNRLSRTPPKTQNWHIKASFLRAFWIILYGLFSSFLMGLAVLDLLGWALIRVSFEEIEDVPYMYTGLFGDIYLKGLLILFPFALLIGVIVQVFWEEKSITHPLE